MSFFGNTLVERKLVSAEQLTEALVIQSEELASPIRICLTHDLLKPMQLVEAVCLAAEEHLTIPDALLHLNYLDHGQIDMINLELKKLRRPVGQILVENTGLELSKLAPLLSQHLVSQDHLPDADGFDFHFPEVHGETKKQYLGFFTSELKKQIETLIPQLQHLNLAQLKQDSSPSRTLEDILQQLSAAAGFARMEISKHLVERATMVMEALNTGRCQWDSTTARMMTNDFLRTLDVLWELQRFIELSGSEKEFWHNAQSRQNYLNAFQVLEHYLAK